MGGPRLSRPRKEVNKKRVSQAILALIFSLSQKSKISKFFYVKEELPENSFWITITTGPMIFIA
jgi:hypothetical protein